MFWGFMGKSIRVSNRASSKGGWCLGCRTKVNSSKLHRERDRSACRSQNARVVTGINSGVITTTFYLYPFTCMASCTLLLYLFSHLHSGNKDRSYLRGLLAELGKTRDVKGLAQFLVHSKRCHLSQQLRVRNEKPSHVGEMPHEPQKWIRGSRASNHPG